jgi:hypothetical protein
MGTRSAIGYFENNNIIVTYCHYDGYYEGVGMTLYKHYNKDRLAYQLTDLGYISSLGETIKEIKDANEQIEALVPIMFATPTDFIKEATVKFWEYLYLWDTNYLQWFVNIDPYSHWRSLKDVLTDILNDTQTTSSTYVPASWP